MKEFSVFNSKKNNFIKVFVDDEDFERVKKYSWHLTKTGYVRTNYTYASGIRGPLYLSRFVLGIVEQNLDIEINHKNRNKLDNRKENLEKCSHIRNMWNIGPSIGKKLKGSFFHKQSGKWQSYIMYKYKKIYLGLFSSELDAAKAYDRAACYYYGEHAYLNFPEEVRAEWFKILTKL